MPSGRRVSGVRSLVVTALVSVSLGTARVRAQAPQDPTTVTLINQGLALLNGGTALSDVTLQANVTYTAGSNIQTGTATLQALGDGNSLIVLSLTGGQMQYISNNQGGWPSGAWIGTDGSLNLYAFQNCWTDAAWFFPGLIFTGLPGNPQIGVVNLGPGSWNGNAVNEIQLYQLITSQGTALASLIQGFSTETIYPRLSVLSMISTVVPDPRT
jgi:hypothetical protein